MIWRKNKCNHNIRWDMTGRLPFFRLTDDYTRLNTPVKRSNAGRLRWGIKAKNGIVLIVDKRVSSKLLEAASIEKIFRLTITSE